MGALTSSSCVTQARKIKTQCIYSKQLRASTPVISWKLENLEGLLTLWAAKAPELPKGKSRLP